MPATHPQCPVDDSPLEPHAHGAVAFHGCRRCHGLWFTRQAMDRARTGPVIADPFVGRPHPAGEAAPGFDVRLCPGCGQAMRTRDVDGVEVDACPRCRSRWLDAGELDTVLAWQRLRDGPVMEPAAAAAVAATTTLAARQEPHREHAATSALDAAEGALEVADGVVEVAVEGSWISLELLGDLAGFLGEAVSGGGEVAVELAGGVLSLVGGLLDGL